MPVHQFFQGFDDEGALVHIPAGTGLVVSRAEGGDGMSCELISNTAGQVQGFEPYVVTLTAPLATTMAQSQRGTEFIYVLEGQITYRYGKRQIELSLGDALVFDAVTPHGPERIAGARARYICVLLHRRMAD